MSKTLEFAIKKDILKSGAVIYTPVVRHKRLIFPEQWGRITLIYGRYVVLDLNFEPELSHEQCGEHIINYQNQLRKEQEHLVEQVEFDVLEEIKF